MCFEQLLQAFARWQPGILCDNAAQPILEYRWIDSYSQPFLPANTVQSCNCLFDSHPVAALSQITALAQNHTAHLVHLLINAFCCMKLCVSKSLIPDWLNWLLPCLNFLNSSSKYKDTDGLTIFISVFLFPYISILFQFIVQSIQCLRPKQAQVTLTCNAKHVDHGPNPLRTNPLLMIWGQILYNLKHERGRILYSFSKTNIFFVMINKTLWMNMAMVAGCVAFDV